MSEDNIPYPRNRCPPWIEMPLEQSQTLYQNNYMSMTKLGKPHYKKLKAQSKENTSAWSLGWDSMRRDWRGSYGRQIQICPKQTI